jgi:hypothetical protein
MKTEIMDGVEHTIRVDEWTACPLAQGAYWVKNKEPIPIDKDGDLPEELEHLGPYVRFNDWIIVEVVYNQRLLYTYRHSPNTGDEGVEYVCYRCVYVRTLGYSEIHMAADKDDMLEWLTINTKMKKIERPE